MEHTVQPPSVPHPLTEQNISAYNAAVPRASLSTLIYPPSARPDAPTPEVDGTDIWDWLDRNKPDKIPADSTAEKREEAL